MKRLTVAIAAASLSACAAIKDKLPSFDLFKADTAKASSADNPNFREFGRFVGSWDCKSEQRGENGWQAQPGVAKWRWETALNGYAIQDYWTPPAEAENPLGVGTNLRIYNQQRERWEIVWTTAAQQEWDFIWAKQVGEKMVMHMQRPERAGMNAHVARISFFNISKESFDWRYEAAPISDSRNYSEAFRISCTRS